MTTDRTQDIDPSDLTIWEEVAERTWMGVKTRLCIRHNPTGIEVRQTDPGQRSAHAARAELLENLRTLVAAHKANGGAVTLPNSRAAKLAQALRWALKWIDTVPQELPLPAMPGFNREYVDGLLEGSAEPTQGDAHLDSVLTRIAEKLCVPKDDAEKLLGKMFEQLDEADRRAGAADRMYDEAMNDAERREKWLDDAKDRAGYHRVTPFDTVFDNLVGAQREAARVLEDNDVLLKFYNVKTARELIEAQAKHITELQAKIPPLRDEFPRSPRRG
jgi:hypothetical protein